MNCNQKRELQTDKFIQAKRTGVNKLRTDDFLYELQTKHLLQRKGRQQLVYP